MKALVLSILCLVIGACNGKDGAVDGTVDHDVDAPDGIDQDGDGFTVDDDCDDTDSAVNPAATEICDGTNTDEDCDSLIDDADGSLDLSTAGTGYADTDEDGYGDPAAAVTVCEKPIGYIANGKDCDDTDPMIYPGSLYTGDLILGLDWDCDGEVWCRNDTDGDGYGDDRYGYGIFLYLLSADDICGNDDGEASLDAPDTDCNDENAAINPGAVETCNSLDDDCDDLNDEGFTYYYATLDGDGDGVGGNASAAGGCPGTEPPGYSTITGDCNDANPNVYPGATEVCDGDDNDCDTLIDEEEICAP